MTVLLSFVSFPNRKDALLANHDSNVEFYSSGSIGLYIKGKCIQTNENNTLNSNDKYDWCSDIAPSNEHPYIIYTMKDNLMKLKGYSIRSGCCYYYCCSVDKNGNIIDRGCCCYLYSFSLLGSNDNITWKHIHRIEKEREFWACKTETYDFPLTESFKYIKFELDEPYPGCPNCVQINQMELYGELIQDYSSYENDDNDESISIIGKVRSSND